jgi:hypothetical protein
MFHPYRPVFLLSRSRGAEKTPELAAGGIKGFLLIFATVIEQWAALLDHFEKVLFDRPLSQGLIVVEIANELPAECPYIVDVFLNRLPRQVRGCQVFKERAEAGHQLLAWWQVFFQPHPRAWPTVQIAAVMFKVPTWRGSGTGYLGSFRLHYLPFHAATHHDSKPLSPLSGIRLPAGQP